MNDAEREALLKWVESAVQTPGGMTVNQMIRYNKRQALIELLNHPDYALVPIKTQEMYQKILYAVATKIPNETRAETALRYVKEREECYFGPEASEGGEG